LRVRPALGGRETFYYQFAVDDLRVVAGKSKDCLRRRQKLFRPVEGLVGQLVGAVESRIEVNQTRN
jgi:hypothetical protein